MLAALLLALAPAPAAPQELDTPARPRLDTRWTADAAAGATWTEHPRPQLRRGEWQSLNGAWRWAVGGQRAQLPDPEGELRVPFPIESRLSGVERAVGPDERLWLWHTFDVPESWADRRVLLHFGAVDHAALVHLNGTMVGRHDGGYAPFTIDVTPWLYRDLPNELRVAVYDPTDAGGWPRGKQTLDPRGIWYTAVTGIWQTVWLEPVASTHVQDLHPVIELDPVGDAGAPRAGRLRLSADVRAARPGDRLVAEARAGDDVVARAEGAADATLTLAVADARPWSPDDPFLYDLRVAVVRDGEELDAVDSYFGLRTVDVRAVDGRAQLLLNGAPWFCLGVLDQGYWPDGLYAAPSAEALRHDLDLVKALGFDTVRKHVKVEPDLWYAHCDRIGLLVWQDLPNGGRHAPWSADGAHDGQEIVRPVEEIAQLRRELRAMIEALEDHPSVVAWVPFNEGWGQAATKSIALWAASLDPTRLVNAASGGNDFPVGDVRDVHAYPGPRMPPTDARRIAFLGEFGGLGLPVPGHLWAEEGSWGYRTLPDAAALEARYAGLMLELASLRERGLAGAIYTQLTDVETEVNGLQTYDREVVKVDPAALRALHERVRAGFPAPRPLRATSEDEPRPWRHVTSAPPDGWTAADFDDAAWTAAPGGFGTRGTPGAVVGTDWDGPEIWLRAELELDAPADDLWLRLHHDEDAEVWLDGELLGRFAGYTTQYTWHPLRGRALAPGRHVLAVHCRQTTGGQFLDAGLYTLAR